MNSCRRHTRKSYGGGIQNDLKQQENILKKLKMNLKWKNVRQFTHEQRAQFPQKVANQQKVVNELRKLAATAKQNNSILATSTNKINNAVTAIKNNAKPSNVAQQSFPAAQNAVAAANQAIVTANATLDQTQKLESLAKSVVETQPREIQQEVNKSNQLVILANRVATRANTLAKNIRSMLGGRRTLRNRRTHCN